MSNEPINMVLARTPPTPRALFLLNSRSLTPQGYCRGRGLLRREHCLAKAQGHIVRFLRTQGVPLCIGDVEGIHSKVSDSTQTGGLDVDTRISDHRGELMEEAKVVKRSHFNDRCTVRRGRQFLSPGLETTRRARSMGVRSNPSTQGTR